jgi:radical SAM superfamily enzyme YgiQ (UPF0313 family)
MFHCLIFNLGSGNAVRGRTSGAYRIATELRMSGWDVEVIDFFYFWKLEELKQLAESRINQDTKFIGFSQIFTEWPQLAEDFCEWLKEKYPSVTIIFGSNTYQNLNSKFIDYYCSGYAELGLKELLNWLYSNGNRPIITLIDRNKIISCRDHYFAAPCRNPIILYEDRDFLLPFEWLGVEFSRGCKFKCAYCNYPILGVKGDWSRDADNFELQMKDVYDRFGNNRYIISDETFNDRTEKITKFADVVEKLDIDLFFKAYIRADLMISRPMDREELLRMGVKGHFYGVESFNHKSAKSIGKGMDPDKMKQGLLDAREYFTTNSDGRYRGTVALIAGLPYESEDSIADGYNWLVKNWGDQSVMINPLDIYKSPEVNNAALFEKNFNEYGYREMTNINEWNNIPGMVNGPQFSKNVILWENDYTNYYRVRKLIGDLTRETYNQFYSFSFNLSQDLSGKGIDYSLTIRGNETNVKEQLSFTRQYIDKKLNY